MSVFKELLGIEDGNNAKTVIQKLVDDVIDKGEEIYGYDNIVYYIKKFGDILLIAQAKHEFEGDEAVLNVYNFDMCIETDSIWDVIPIRQNTSVDEFNRDTMIVRNALGRGFALIHILNADVVPSLLPSDVVALEVFGVPDIINYFKDNEEYACHVEEHSPVSGVGLYNGELIIVGQLSAALKDEIPEDVMLIKGVVTSVSEGEFVIEGFETHKFVRCTIDTDFGLMDIIHNYDNVKPEQRENIKIGSIVEFAGALYGNAAVDEYALGAIRDEDSILCVLKDIFSGGEPNRIFGLLADQASLTFNGETQTFSDFNQLKDSIVKIRKKLGRRPFANTALITRKPGQKARFGAGTPCVVVAPDEDSNFKTVIFVITNEECEITELIIDKNTKYRFELDEDPLDCVFDDEDLMLSGNVPVLAAARRLKLIPDTMSDDYVLNNSFAEDIFIKNINSICKEVPENSDNQLNAFPNILGYLFAKTMELQYNKTRSPGNFEMFNFANVSLEDAIAGRISSSLDPVKHKKLENALKFGEAFFVELLKYYSDETGNDPDDIVFMRMLTEAIVAVQCVGVACANTYLEG